MFETISLEDTMVKSRNKFSLERVHVKPIFLMIVDKLHKQLKLNKLTNIKLY